MPWGISDDEMDQALQDLFGSATDGNGTQAAADQPGPTPSELGITAGILSDVPAHLQAPPTDWSNLDLGLSGTDGASLAGGSPHYHLGGGGSGGFGPASNIAPMGPAGPQNATQVYTVLQSSPVNLNAGMPASAPSLEDAGRSTQFNMTDGDLARVRDYTDARLKDQAILRGAGTVAADAFIPELVAPKIAKEFVPLTIDALNEISEANTEITRERTFQDELWRIMNDRMVQSAMGANAPGGMRGFFVK